MRDLDHSYLNTAETKDDAAMDALRGHSIPYRIALGPHEGRKVAAGLSGPFSAQREAPTWGLCLPDPAPGP